MKEINLISRDITDPKCKCKCKCQGCIREHKKLGGYQPCSCKNKQSKLPPRNE